MGDAAPQYCSRCGAAFKSRNRLFAHLRSSASTSSSSCGDGSAKQAISRGSLQTLAAEQPPPPPPPPGCELWLGDVPSTFNASRLLRSLGPHLHLSDGGVDDAELPLIKRLVRKGYRALSAAPVAEGGGGGGRAAARPQHLGYAILRFRDAAAASAALARLDGAVLSAPIGVGTERASVASFQPRVHLANTAKAERDAAAAPALAEGNPVRPYIVALRQL